MQVFWRKNTYKMEFSLKKFGGFDKTPYLCTV